MPKETLTEDQWEEVAKAADEWPRGTREDAWWLDVNGNPQFASDFCGQTELPPGSKP